MQTTLALVLLTITGAGAHKCNIFCVGSDTDGMAWNDILSMILGTATTGTRVSCGSRGSVCEVHR